MSATGVKDELVDKIYRLDPRDFELFCKIVVEEVEQPTDIELTPFHGDGGIDIRGIVGLEFYNAQFGIQVKQFEGDIGTPAMRNFIGALSQHNYQYGAFITTSDFNSGAVDVANEQRTNPITLINRNALTDIMLRKEVGIITSGNRVDLDPGFWSIFDRTTSDQPVDSFEVPQADSLNVLINCLEAIDKGYRYKPEITDYMERKTRDDWDPRQADYYPAAGYALGYVHKDTKGKYQGRQMRRWGLTREGQEYIHLRQSGKDTEAENHLNQHIREMEISKRILPIIEDKGSISKSRLAELILENSELGEVTSDRRASTLGKWYSQLPEIRRVKDGQSLRFDWVSSNLDDYSATS